MEKNENKKNKRENKVEITKIGKRNFVNNERMNEEQKDV